MKTSDEMTREVLARIGEETRKKARRRKRAQVILGTGGTVCLTVLAAVGIARLPETEPFTESAREPESAAAVIETQTANSQANVPAKETQSKTETSTEETGTQQGQTAEINGGVSRSNDLAFTPNIPYRENPNEPLTAQTLPYLIRGEETVAADPIKYPCPEPGRHTITLPLSQAVAANAGNENAYYFLRFEVMNDALSAMTPQEQEAFYLAEADRMKAAGAGDKIDFSVETFEDKNTGETVVTFAGLLRDPSFLDAFPDNPDYGYFIALHDENACVK